MLAVWAETGLVLADQFRDGNVPAQMEPLEVAKRAFGVLPKTVKEFYSRGDSACHESNLLNWLRDEKREGGPQGKIGFAISARMSEALHRAIEAAPEREWQSYGEPDGEEIRECAEVPFVPGEKAEKKDTQPLRYVAIRIRKKQGELFEDGSRVRHFAVLTNRWELTAARLIEWHREKAGTIELVHDAIKNESGGGVLPSKYFGANAAWLRLAVISHNVLVALTQLALPAELVTARPKRLRFLIFNTPGRLVHHARRLILRLAAAAEWIAAVPGRPTVAAARDLSPPAPRHSGYRRISKPLDGNRSLESSAFFPPENLGDLRQFEKIVTAPPKPCLGTVAGGQISSSLATNPIRPTAPHTYRRIRTFLLAVLLSCGSGSGPASNNLAEPVVSVSLTEHNSTLGASETHQSAATVAGSSNKNIT